MNKWYILFVLIIFGFLFGAVVYIIYKLSVMQPWSGTDSAKKVREIVYYIFGILLLVGAFSNAVVFAVIYSLRVRGYTLKKVKKETKK
ncbi:hypothetical protein [Metamycoplasma neophronis]|nr:hypothetical protein [Metamycoplasma neophronis]